MEERRRPSLSPTVVPSAEKLFGKTGSPAGVDSSLFWRRGLACHRQLHVATSKGVGYGAELDQPIPSTPSRGLVVMDTHAAASVNTPRKALGRNLSVWSS